MVKLNIRMERFKILRALVKQCMSWTTMGVWMLKNSRDSFSTSFKKIRMGFQAVISERQYFKKVSGSSPLKRNCWAHQKMLRF